MSDINSNVLLRLIFAELFLLCHTVYNALIYTCSPNYPIIQKIDNIFHISFSQNETIFNNVYLNY